jgi:hypothetical protein
MKKTVAVCVAACLVSAIGWSDIALADSISVPAAFACVTFAEGFAGTAQIQSDGTLKNPGVSDTSTAEMNVLCYPNFGPSFNHYSTETLRITGYNDSSATPGTVMHQSSKACVRAVNALSVTCGSTATNSAVGYANMEPGLSVWNNIAYISYDAFIHVHLNGQDRIMSVRSFSF